MILPSLLLLGHCLCPDFYLVSIIQAISIIVSVVWVKVGLEVAPAPTPVVLQLVIFLAELAILLGGFPVLPGLLLLAVAKAWVGRLSGHLGVEGFGTCVLCCKFGSLRL
jgi:hypothetical protein